MTLGVLGGTFDPVHNGHVAAARAAQEALTLDAIVLIPSHIPPHRAHPAGAGSEQRFAMAQLAASEQPGWSASRIELDRSGRSYTYDTLVELGRPPSQIFFILGADAFAEIATWSRYPAVLDRANFVVVSRPGITLDSLRERVPTAFQHRPAAETRVILVDAHTPDISATDIRRRVHAGDSIHDLVPASVEHYITTHRLYRGH
ncbi:MAG TPA: nicotinate-nucleotide adenylyltransferase [Vicinamibacterales bacterium]|nr:nicotinate-nucleotide adenylyltransferase [Vicinamibacterales bacterium]